MSKIKSREEAIKDPSVLQEIQERAYYIAESAGFTPGREHENWLTAEEEVLTKMMANGTAKPEKSLAAKAAVKQAPAAETAPAVEAPKATAKPKATTTKAATTKVAPAKDPAASAAPAKRATKKNA